LAGIVFISVMAFHIVYHGWLKHQGLLPKRGDARASFQTILGMFGFGEEPKSHKYLPEQRLAYATLGGTGLVLVLTGILKVFKNLPGVFLSPTLVTWTTLMHTFFTFFFFLGVLAHLAALVLRVNRPLVKPYSPVKWIWITFGIATLYGTMNSRDPRLQAQNLSNPLSKSA
jgi:cytochrome b subunit of formate dehydrogenase